MSAKKSLGMSLSIGALDIGELTSIGPVGVESEEIDVTTLDTEDGFRQVIGGLKDVGEISFGGVIKNKANVESMHELSISQEVSACKIITDDGDEWSFDAFVMSFREGENTVTSARTFELSLRASGKIAYDPATS